MFGGSKRRQLYRLIYRSELSPRMPLAEAEQDAEISKILAVAVPGNRLLSLTGLLLVYQRWFIQTLEGTATEVSQLYTKIKGDPRHQDATIISEEVIPQRQFHKWSMCARRLEKGDDAVFRAIDFKGAFNPATLSATEALDLLLAVRNVQLMMNQPAAGGYWL